MPSWLQGCIPRPGVPCGHGRWRENGSQASDLRAGAGLLRHFALTRRSRYCHSRIAARAFTRDILPDNPARRRYRRHVHRRGAGNRRAAGYGEDSDHAARPGRGRARRVALRHRPGGARAPPGRPCHPWHPPTLPTKPPTGPRAPSPPPPPTEGSAAGATPRHENRFEQYDVNIDLPPPLVPRRLRLPIRERIDAHGEVLVPLDESSVARAIEALAAQRVEAVAVGLLHSFTNPDHERRVGDAITRPLPQVAVTLSCEVSPEMREYERFSTACANAYLQPLIGRYLAKLDRELLRAGFRCPLLLMTSGGGITTSETAIRFPVR